MPLLTDAIIIDSYTTVERDALVLPASKLMIYNVTDSQYQVNDGTPSVPVWTASSNLTTNDVPESTDKNYVTDAESIAIDNLSGTNSGDVTLAGVPNYITIAGQIITRSLINLVNHVTGILPVLNGGTGVTTYTALTASLDIFTDLLKGLVPASGGGTTNFLRADGTWAAPAGGGGLENKAGCVAAGSFTGSPKAATVSFSSAFADTNYAVTITAVMSDGSKNYVVTTFDKLAGSFKISLNSSSTTDLVEVCWEATKNGES